MPIIQEGVGSGGSAGLTSAQVRVIAKDEIGNAVPETQFKTLADLIAAPKMSGETYTVWDDPDPEENGIYDYAPDAGGAGTGPGLVKVAHAVVNPSGGTTTGGVTEARVNELIEDNRGSYKDYATPADIPDNHIGRVDGKLYAKDEGSDQPDLLRDQS